MVWANKKIYHVEAKAKMLIIFQKTPYNITSLLARFKIWRSSPLRQPAIAGDRKNPAKLKGISKSKYANPLKLDKGNQEPKQIRLLTILG